MSQVPRGPHECHGEGCHVVLVDNRMYCGECAESRKDESRSRSPKQRSARKAPRQCRMDGCSTTVTGRKQYCEKCRVIRIAESQRRYEERRNKKPVVKSQKAPEETRNGGMRPMRFFSGRAVVVVHDPDPYPLSEGLKLDKYETMTMVAERCFTPGTRLFDIKNKTIYQVGAA